MTRACLCLLAGCYALQLSSFAIDSDLTTTAFVASVILLATPRMRPCGFFLAGVALFGNAAQAVIDSRIAPELAGDSIVASVRIDDFPESGAASVRFVAVPLDDPRLPPLMHISWFDPPVDLRLGDTWRLELRLRRPRGTSNPGVFDYEEWLFRQGIGATGYVVNSHRNHLLNAGTNSAVDGVRQRFVTRVTERFADSRTAAVLAALVVGARHRITREQWENYARTGTSHLIAISGLHIGLAAAGGYLLTVLVAGVANRRGNNHRIAIVVSLSVAAMYAFVAGLAVPAQRAGLMIAIAGLLLLRRRVPRPSVIICSACISIVVAAPLATMAPGFKLSFGAVALLFWLAQRCRRPNSIHSGRLASVLNWFRQLAGLQVLLLLGLLPIVVLVFARLTLVAPLVNVVVVPLFSLVTVPFALLGLILDGPFAFAGDRALDIAAYSIAVMEQIVTAGASFAWSAIEVPAVSGLAWLYIALPVVWVLAPPAWPGRSVAWLALIAIVVHVPRGPGTGCAAIGVLDVGQGLATIVRTENHVLVFDTGPSFRGGGSAAETVVLPYLASRGIDRIDRLVISHADLDHAGGASALLKGLEVTQLIVGETLPKSDRVTRRCEGGESWRRDDIGFRFLHPPADSIVDGNNASCVLLIEVGSHRILLTGDIERPAEQQLVRAGVLSEVTAVVVPHHGSRTSSTRPFVRALSPAVAIVSAGFDNRWGFPKQDVVDRWQEAGAKVLVTATSGAIQLAACAASTRVRVGEQRQMRHRIWHE